MIDSNVGQRNLMVTVATLVPRIPGAVSKRVRRVSKQIYQTVRWRALERPKVLFIVGCQRSGTTLMTRLFDSDFNCRVFGEFSELSSADKPHGIRLNPLPDVESVISRVRAPLVVCKPLVETQNVRELLDYFPSSKALFMYRRYADVARSDMTKFGVSNGVSNLRPIAFGDPQNWRSAGASRAVQELVRRFWSEDMNDMDAAALFWYARNQLFFDLHLESHPAVLLCQYEHLTQHPANVMQRIYEFVAVDPPETLDTAEVHTSPEKGLELRPEIREVCDQLQARLDAHFETRSAATGDSPLHRRTPQKRATS
jgi:Sulfotransferase domain